METEGVLEVRAYYRPYNYFSGLDNIVDPVHVAFTHLKSSFDLRGGLSGVPKVYADESAWGLTMRGERPNGRVRTTQIGMPNINQITGTPDASGSGWSISTLWRVPIDDEHHIEVVTNRIPLTGEAGRDYEKRRAEELARYSTPIEDLAEAILRGDLLLEEIEEHAHMVALQDAVTQGGQGVIPDREHERLGRNDAGVILFRNLWLQELQALAEGRPLRQWVKPEGLLPSPG
jgi:5,5'-dehydrodivanillate O-demethylase